MTRAVILVLALLWTTWPAGTNPILEWFNDVLGTTLGITFVPPSDREDTCRDCTSEEGRSFVFATEPPAPCCTTPPPPSFSCGVEGSTRILGGVQSTVGKYPWIVAYLKSGQDPGSCAGTLVAAEWVVTAAHCLDGVDKDNLKIILGEYDLTSDTDSEDTNRKEVSLALDPFIHNRYNSTSLSHNIALLKLAEKVNLTVYTPACLPAFRPGLDTDYTGKTGSVYGWGTTASCPNSDTGKILSEVEVPIGSDTTCVAASGDSVTFSDGEGGCSSQALNYNDKISDDMVCAGAQDTDACQGDSGGPLTVKNANSQHDLVGVVSWGYGCAAADKLYGVYSEVAKSRTWIDSTIFLSGGATCMP